MATVVAIIISPVMILKGKILGKPHAGNLLFSTIALLAFPKVAHAATQNDDKENINSWRNYRRKLGIDDRDEDSFVSMVSSIKDSFSFESVENMIDKGIPGQVRS